MLTELEQVIIVLTDVGQKKKIKVALNPLPRIFSKFAESLIATC